MARGDRMRLTQGAQVVRRKKWGTAWPERVRGGEGGPRVPSRGTPLVLLCSRRPYRTNIRRINLVAKRDPESERAAGEGSCIGIARITWTREGSQNLSAIGDPKFSRAELRGTGPEGTPAGVGIGDPKIRAAGSREGDPSSARGGLKISNWPQEARRGPWARISPSAPRGGAAGVGIAKIGGVLARRGGEFGLPAVAWGTWSAAWR